MTTLVPWMWIAAAAIWVLAAYWQMKTRQPGLAAMNVAVAAIHAAVGAMYLAGV